jgi:hypothetical protein
MAWRAPTLRASAARLVERTNQESWTHKRSSPPACSAESPPGDARERAPDLGWLGSHGRRAGSSLRSAGLGGTSALRGTRRGCNIRGDA